MSKRIAIININLEYEIPKNLTTKKQVKDFVFNKELPSNYQENSFKFVKVLVRK